MEKQEWSKYLNEEMQELIWTEFKEQRQQRKESTGVIEIEGKMSRIDNSSHSVNSANSANNGGNHNHNHKRMQE